MTTRCCTKAITVSLLVVVEMGTSEEVCEVLNEAVWRSLNRKEWKQFGRHSVAAFEVEQEQPIGV